jgi:hypothetical protein
MPDFTIDELDDFLCGRQIVAPLMIKLRGEIKRVETELGIIFQRVAKTKMVAFKLEQGCIALKFKDEYYVCMTDFLNIADLDKISLLKLKEQLKIEENEIKSCAICNKRISYAKFRDRFLYNRGFSEIELKKVMLKWRRESAGVCDSCGLLMVCPVCSKKNHLSYIIAFLTSQDKDKRLIRHNLLRTIKLNYKQKLNLKIGIPCCKCFRKVFGRSAPISPY